MSSRLRSLSYQYPLVVLLAAIVALAVVPNSADATPSAEQQFVDSANRERRAVGLRELVVRSDLITVARRHSDTMAAEGRLHHNPNLASDVLNWERVAENVGYGPSVTSVHDAFMRSSKHRDTILNPHLTEIGIGVTQRNGSVWVTQVFRRPTASSAVVLSEASSAIFDDVFTSNVHLLDIERLSATGITRGCGYRRYCPTDAVTREQMASLLVRALDLPKAPSQGFVDVSGTHAADIDALAAAGITKGCNPPRNDRYCPTGTVTRAQMASFLGRGLRLASGPEQGFRDVGGVHAADIDALAAAGITKGCNPPTNDRFCPNDTVTRAQMASFIVRGIRP